MKVAGSIALVTDANQGLGITFAKALLEMGGVKGLRRGAFGDKADIIII